MIKDKAIFVNFFLVDGEKSQELNTLVTQKFKYMLSAPTNTENYNLKDFMEGKDEHNTI